MKGKMLVRLNNLFAKIFLIIFITGLSNFAYSEEKKSEFLEEQIRTTPPIEEEENNEKVQ